MLLAILTITTSVTCSASAVPLMGPVITTASNPGDQFTPAVAWDHVHKRWLVVWEQDVSGVRTIVGRLIANNGYPLVPSFFISEATTDHTDPDVVYDPGNDRYLVVWVHECSATDSDIVGRFIPWDGLDPALPSYQIESPTTLQVAPALEYAPFPIDELFLVWEDHVDVQPATIRAKRLDPDTGDAITPSFEVVGAGPDQCRHPRLAWNAEAGRYLVVYERLHEGSSYNDIYAASVGYSGTVFEPALGIAGYSAEERQPDVASCNGSWMVVWINGVGDIGGLYMRPVSGNLSLGPSHWVDSPISGKQWPAVAGNPYGVEYLVTWQQYYSNGHYSVLGRMLSDAGPASVNFAFQLPSVGDLRDFTRPAVAVGDYQRRAYVVWEADRDDLLHQDLAGRWIDLALFSDDFETGTTTRWSAVGM